MSEDMEQILFVLKRILLPFQDVSHGKFTDSLIGRGNLLIHLEEDGYCMACIYFELIRNSTPYIFHLKTYES